MLGLKNTYLKVFLKKVCKSAWLVAWFLVPLSVTLYLLLEACIAHSKGAISVWKLPFLPSNQQPPTFMGADPGPSLSAAYLVQTSLQVCSAMANADWSSHRAARIKASVRNGAGRPRQVWQGGWQRGRSKH